MKFLTRAMAGRMSIQKEKKMKRMIRMTRKMTTKIRRNLSIRVGIINIKDRSMMK